MSESFERRGLLARALSLLFAEVGSHRNTLFKIGISCVEIHNNKLHDLLAPHAQRSADLPISDDGETVKVKGLEVRSVQSESDALAAVFAGLSARADARGTSARSHCIFTVHIGTQSPGDPIMRTRSKLTFVDLAGSTRINPRGVQEPGAPSDAEIRHINLSLSCLERVIVSATTSGLNKFLPYRQSKLTHFLRDSIGHNSATTMIATISSDASLAEYTISTLRLAERMRGVVAITEPQVEITAADTIHRLQSEVTMLQQELSMRDALDRRHHASTTPLTPFELHEVKLLANKFASKEISQIPITGVRQVDALFVAFRDLLQAKDADHAKEMAKVKEEHKQPCPTCGLASAALAAGKMNRKRDSVSGLAGVVGKLTGGGVSVGQADADGPKMTAKGKKPKSPRNRALEHSAHEVYIQAVGVLTDALRQGEADVVATINAATPEQKDVMVRSVDISRAVHEVFGTESDKGGTLAEKARALAAEGIAAVRLGDMGIKLGPRKKPAPDLSGLRRDEMFELFKKTAGKKYASILDANNKALHEHQVASRDLAIRLNQFKSGIDRVAQEKAQIESYFADGGPVVGNAMVDEPSLKLHEEMVSLKQQYRETHVDYSGHQREIGVIEEKNIKCRRQMLRAFDEWFLKEENEALADSALAQGKHEALDPDAVMFETVRLQVRRAASSPSTRRIPVGTTKRLNWETGIAGFDSTQLKHLPKLAFT